VATTDGWGIWTGTASTEASWALIRFLETDEWNDVFMRVTGNQSARKSLADRWVKTTKESIPEMADKNLAAFTEPLTKGYARPNAVFRFDDDVRPLLNDAVSKTLDKNEAPLADTMRNAVATVNAKLKQLAGS
jgi:ABC-type glycerol-3-phosphate transport system substrate-binding protein